MSNRDRHRKKEITALHNFIRSIKSEELQRIAGERIRLLTGLMNRKK